MSAIAKGCRVKVTTDAFPGSVPQGSICTVAMVSTANTPPVPYYYVEVKGGEIGFYADEIASQETSE